MKKFQYLGFGANSQGQLGNNTTKDSWIATPILINFNAKDNTLKGEITDNAKDKDELVDIANEKEKLLNYLENQPKEIRVGGAHTLLLDSEGKVFSSGWNLDNQLGISNENENQLFFTPISLDSRIRIKSVAAGWSHSLLISEDYEIFSFGSNLFGQCGFPNSQKTIKSPQKIYLENNQIPKTKNKNKTNEQSNKKEEKKEKTKKQFISASCGLKHSLLLTIKGIVYSMGQEKFAALGYKTSTNIESPKKVKELKNFKILKIFAGWKHSLCCTEQKVFSFGTSKFGALGLGEKNLKIFEPTICFEEKETTIKNIFCGSNSSLIVTDNFQMYTFGRNQLGQLGNGTKENKFIPTKIDFNFNEKIIDIYYGNEHGLLLTESQKIYGFGWNEHSNLGIEHTKNLFSPTLISQFNSNNSQKKYTIVSISTGSASSFILTKIIEK